MAGFNARQELRDCCGSAQRHCAPVRLSAGRQLRAICQIRHDRAACPRGPGRVLLRTIGGALIQPVCQSGAGAELLQEASDVVAALPAACRTFDAQHIELADQTSDRSVAGHVRSLDKAKAAFRAEYVASKSGASQPPYNFVRLRLREDYTLRPNDYVIEPYPRCRRVPYHLAAINAALENQKVLTKIALATALVLSAASAAMANDSGENHQDEDKGSAASVSAGGAYGYTAAPIHKHRPVHERAQSR
jgi:hypothetical protein